MSKTLITNVHVQQWARDYVESVIVLGRSRHQAKKD